MRSLGLLTASVLLASSHALDIDFSNTQSIKDGAKTIASHVVGIYRNSNSTSIPGLFPKPYYWWESGQAFDTLINYATLTGDDEYNDLITNGLLWQVGTADNYLPSNQTSTLGNDDQSFWALACMTAAENGFPEPPASKGVKSWLELAQNVFDSQVLRWDNKTCDGGLRWQIYPFNVGYDYKNTLTNGNFMQLAARLAHYTGNTTYSSWVNQTSHWSFDVGFVNQDSFAVYDGASVGDNCKQVNKIQWTSSLGTYLSASAYTYNLTSSKLWSDLTWSLFANAYSTFASTPGSPKNGVLTEVACAGHNNCNTDQQAFRAVLARALANTRDLERVDPNTSGAAKLSSDLDNLIRTSGEGAAAQCSGGTSGTVCGTNWGSGTWDKTQGLGQDLSALEIILANINSKAGLQTESGSAPGKTGTTSSGGSSASSSASPANTNAASGKVFSVLEFVLGLAVAIFYTI